MLTYVLLSVLVGAFVAVASIGHVLILLAMWPNIFGTPQLDGGDADVSPREPSQKLAV